jgi:hypothetical protein
MKLSILALAFLGALSSQAQAAPNDGYGKLSNTVKASALLFGLHFTL